MIRRRMNRVTPKLPAGHFKTYQIASPIATHYRDGSCEEVDCEWQANGFKTVVDESTPLGQRQAHYIRKVSDRPFTEERTPEGLTAFKFPPGTTCFSQHKVSLERPEIYLVKGGDFRGNPRRTPIRRHSGPDSWINDFAEHQDKLKRTIEG